MDWHNFFFWSFPVTRFAGTEIRISWLMPALAIILCLVLGWQLGLVLAVIITVCVLFHEFGHVLAARATGGAADEIILSPLGGLALAQPGPGHLAQFLTAGAGPLVNLVICAFTFPGLYAPEHLPGVLVPVVPLLALNPQTLGIDLLLLTFHASWVLLIFNMLPVYPLDCGQMLQAALSSRFPADVVHRWMIYTSIGTAVLLMCVGLVIQWPSLVLFGAIIMLLNVIQTSQPGSAEFADDSFMGYDFSQGYTSLERSSGGSTTEREPRQSSWQRWKARRQARREQQARERQQQDEAQLDELLGKVHEHGYQSLTSAEKRLLERVSTDYRERSKRPSS